MSTLKFRHAILVLSTMVLACHGGPPRNAGSGSLQGAVQLQSGQSKILVGGPVTITHASLSGAGTILIYRFAGNGKTGVDADCVSSDRKGAETLAAGDHDIEYAAPQGTLVCVSLQSGADMTMMWTGFAR